jgi:hypothetical protein
LPTEFVVRLSLTQQANESIGAIAAALAKAQCELANPEKSLTATIRASHPRESDQTFRYAALSTGLDIVRKSLGAHEIATVQTTAIDREAGLIRLTTVLAHSSGEWLTWEWPVCAISETAPPRRMGAALTYARRYALFTLVGIAGEDDLDAPDLGSGPRADPNPAYVNGSGPPENPASPSRIILSRAAPPPAAARGKARIIRPAKSLLADEESAALRDRLIAELDELTSADEAANWVHRRMPDKNLLKNPDGQLVESRFKEKLEAFAVEQAQEPSTDAGQVAPEPDPRLGDENGVGVFAEVPEEIRPLRRRVVGKTIRLRDKEHTRFVSRQPCVVCGRTPADPHHLRFAQPRALGRRGSDEYTVPVCRTHHRELHRYGDEGRGGVPSMSIPFRSRSRYGDERDRIAGRNRRAMTRSGRGLRARMSPIQIILLCNFSDPGP